VITDDQPAPSAANLRDHAGPVIRDDRPAPSAANLRDHEAIMIMELRLADRGRIGPGQVTAIRAVAVIAEIRCGWRRLRRAFLGHG
jgi:hypothetical protein